MKTIAAILAITLTGCSTTGDYSTYVAAQAEANRQAFAEQKPLVRLTAQPGQAITGLAGLEVYMPGTAPTIQQARPNEWAGVVGQGLSVVGAVLGIKYAGEAAIGLANSVGNAGTAGYAHVQAPAANVTTTTTTNTVGANSGANSGNAGRLAGGSLSDAVTTTTTTTTLPPVTSP
jgi:hypothetical protein